MTPAEIDALPAGPELDRLVAERVMGNSTFSISPTLPLEEGRHGPDGNCTGTRTLAPYSNSVNHAFEVVLHMRSTPMNWFSLNWYGDSEEWYASFGDGCTSRDGVAATASLAICRAALKAVS
jgi:hypothetical protein